MIGQHHVCLAFQNLSIVLILIAGGVYCKCGNGDIRYDPENLDKLLIQVCIDNSWGYLCSQGSVFSWEDVNVVCNQLGYTADENSLVSVVLDSRIEGSLIFSSFYCTGLENRLIDCAIHGTYPTLNKGCKKDKKFYYTSVNCTYDEVVCTNGDIRAVGQELSVCVNGDWYSLCGDAEGWNNQDAQVACRSLGKNPLGARALRSVGGVDSYLLRFHCAGDEKSLLECPRSLVDKCENDDVALFSCGDPVEQPLNIVLESSHSQVKLSWTTPTTPFNYQYQVSCATVVNTSSPVTSSSSSHLLLTGPGANTAVLSGLLPITEYNCCVASVLNETFSDPVCELLVLPEEEQELSCSAQITRTSESQIQTISASITVPENSNQLTDRVSAFEEYGPWLFGYIAGLGTGVVLMLLLCGCVLCIGRNKRRQVHNIIKTEDFVSVNANAHQLDSGRQTTNPLYGSQEDSNKYEPEEKPFNSPDEYAYIDKRSPADLPNQIQPYHTVLVNNEYAK